MRLSRGRLRIGKPEPKAPGWWQDPHIWGKTCIRVEDFILVHFDGLTVTFDFHFHEVHLLVEGISRLERD